MMPSSTVVTVQNNKGSDTTPPTICESPSWSTTGVTVAGGLTSGSALNQLQIPLDLFVDKQDAIYIADSLNHRIVKWDQGAREGRLIIGGAGAGNESHQFHYITAMFIDKEGSIYVGDNHNHRIQKWKKDSTRGETIIGKFGRGTGLNQIDNCWGLYVDREFNVYVSEHSNHRVTKWTPGAEQGQIVAHMWKPVGIYVDEYNGNIYVASYHDDSIQQFNQNGTFIREIGKYLLDSPYDFVLIPDSDSNNRAVMIADSKHHRIVKMSMNNPHKLQIIAGVTGEQGNESNHLNEPRGIRFDSKGNLIVVDSNNNRVQNFMINNNNCDI
ncbi:unnamed protein product [Adineta steineri]|uniref:NHL repeat containing protein n=1 Tax=Adineta steineri TaxID=433720 RepID=A0A814I2D8_9BILA|nr:unnamed protein product [Adineta steineri]CAF3824654.1 unnamed protein product [Adineta steineri]